MLVRRQFRTSIRSQCPGQMEGPPKDDLPGDFAWRPAPCQDPQSQLLYGQRYDGACERFLRVSAS